MYIFFAFTHALFSPGVSIPANDLVMLEAKQLPLIAAVCPWLFESAPGLAWEDIQKEEALACMRGQKGEMHQPQQRTFPGQ